MKLPLLQATSIVCAGAMLFTGCTNIKDDQRRTKTEGALAGGVAGAVLGGLLGAATGGGASRIATGALAGAAVGTAGGYAYGSHVAKKKGNYASQEAKLRAMIGEARSERRSAESYNSSLRNAIAQQRTELGRISSARKSGQNVRSDAQRLERNLDGNIERTSGELKRKEGVLTEVKATLAESPSSSEKQQLQAEYNSLSKEKALLSKQINQMNGMKQDLATASR
jgi:chromosome segregation ATPase